MQQNGNSVFTANDSKIITNHGDSFYITNTTSTINLKSNTIINNDNTGNFLRVQKDSWGKSGENSAKSITLKIDNTSKMKLTGDCYITELEDSDTTYSNIDFNGYKLYVNGVAIN